MITKEEEPCIRTEVQQFIHHDPGMYVSEERRLRTQKIKKKMGETRWGWKQNKAGGCEDVTSGHYCQQQERDDDDDDDFDDSSSRL